MGNFITSTSFITPSAITAKTANASYPVTNVNDYTHPQRTYKATAVNADQWIKFDLGATPPAVAAIVIDNTNVSSLEIRAHASDLGDTAGTWDSGASYRPTAYTVSTDPVDGRYKLYVAPAQTYRWWLINCAATATIPTGGTWTVGGIALLSAITTWTINAEFPYEVARCRR